MKIKLSFDSREEFITFLINISSISITSYGKEAESLYDSLEKITDISVGEADFYSMKRMDQSSHGMESFSLVNYMLNDVQRKAESIFVIDSQEFKIEHFGIKNVEDFLKKNLHRSFVLRIGWRTEYCEFLLQPTN